MAKSVRRRLEQLGFEKDKRGPSERYILDHGSTDFFWVAYVTRTSGGYSVGFRGGKYVLQVLDGSYDEKWKPLNSEAGRISMLLSVKGYFDPYVPEEFRQGKKN